MIINKYTYVMFGLVFLTAVVGTSVGTNIITSVLAKAK